MSDANRARTSRMPSRDEIAELAHDTFFESEPVPGQPWVNPWPTFADRFLARVEALAEEAR